MQLKTTYFAITLIKEVGKGNHLCFKGLVKAVAGVSQLITTLVANGSPFVKFLQKLVQLVNTFLCEIRNDGVFLTTLVALHLTPVGQWVGGQSFGLA